MDVEGAELDVMTDLKSSGKLSLVRRMVIEYHHRMGPGVLPGRFPGTFGEEGFEYQIAGAGCDPITRQGVFQDILSEPTARHLPEVGGKPHIPPSAPRILGQREGSNCSQSFLKTQREARAQL